MKLLQGDCFEVMQEFPDNSIDLVLTDPPYGLSNGDTKGIADRIGSAFIDVVLPDLYDFNSKSGRLGKFVGPLNSISFLDFMNRAFREEPRIAMPESTVDLQCSPVCKQEVKNESEPSIVCTDRELRGEVNSDGAQFCCDYTFYPRACLDSSLCDSKRVGLRQLGPGRFGMPVVISLNSELARFLCALTPSSPSFLSDIVGLCNDAQTLSCASSQIVASAGAEIRVVLSFDTRNGTIEFLPASGALQGDIVLDVFAAKNIGASAGTCCLSPKFKPSTFSIVGDVTDRAITFYFHDSIISEIETTRKGFMGKTWDGNVPDTAIWAEALRVLKPGGHLLAFAGTRTQHRMACRIEDAGFEIRDMLAWVYGSGFPKSHNGPWGGTALKPALEPITMARKPLVGTVADNVMQYGTGGLNIDACRVATDDNLNGGAYSNGAKDLSKATSYATGVNAGEFVQPTGRWPANLIHDGSEDSAAPMGSAARFFYCAKASKKERTEGNTHPTVKPIALMEYLVKLASRPGAVVLDPFMGSGTTGIACQNLNRNFIGIEMNEEYFEIAKSRINNAVLEKLI